MPSSPDAKRLSRLRSAASGEWASLVLGLFLCCGPASAQSPKPAPQKAPPPRSNELTLAGLRPGRDSVAMAKAKFGTKDMTSDSEAVSWKCGDLRLTLDLAGKSAIRSVILMNNRMPASSIENYSNSETRTLPASCFIRTPNGLELEREDFVLKNLWRTGKGLALGDSTGRLAKIYGEPDSRSPSSRGGQQLELWYYAFDWAGADVPQVMEVLCTKEEDGKPGRVIEITLAAPSL